MSPISSRKSSRRWRSRTGRSGPRHPSRRPARCRRAPISSSVSGSAAQLIATKGFSARSLRAWIIRATSSLPVPLSPVIRTEVFEARPAPTRSSTRRAAGDSPTNSRPAAARPVSSRSRRFSSSRRSRSRVSRSRWRRFSIAIPQRPGQRSQEAASSSSKAAWPPRRTPCPPGRARRPCGLPPRIGTPIAVETGRAQELELLAPQESSDSQQAARRNSSSATTASAGRRGKPTRASARRAPPFAEGRHVAAGRVEHSDRAASTSSTSVSSSGMAPSERPAS